MSYIRYDLDLGVSALRMLIKFASGGFELSNKKHMSSSQSSSSDGTAGANAAAALTPAFSPLYQQIKGLILQSLQAGEWRPGELIPSEMELAGRFKVSQGTVRKAIKQGAQGIGKAVSNWTK